MFQSTTIIRELQYPCQKLSTALARTRTPRVVHSTSKITHTQDAPQAQTNPNNMICCHTTTLSIHTTVVK